MLVWEPPDELHLQAILGSDLQSPSLLKEIFLNDHDYVFSPRWSDQIWYPIFPDHCRLLNVVHSAVFRRQCFDYNELLVLSDCFLSMSFYAQVRQKS
ncbi:hypothetical protein RRG08_001216 [Elysia crispata]|uniref:Uncharacterized protein n=1 Tax=Elysia crispata TaxID=231223 RepID=A0AAE1ECI3_9GAST|nr:hypothetical protein RRG08_001216 [Elysia crispata]